MKPQVFDNSDVDKPKQPQTASFRQQAFGPWSSLDPLVKRNMVTHQRIERFDAQQVPGNVSTCSYDCGEKDRHYRRLGVCHQPVRGQRGGLQRLQFAHQQCRDRQTD